MDFEESYLETLVRPIPFEQFVEERSLLFEECPFLLIRPHVEPPHIDMQQLEFSKVTLAKESKFCYKASRERITEVDELLFIENEFINNEEEALKEIRKKKFEAYYASTAPALQSNDEREITEKKDLFQKLLHVDQLRENKDKAAKITKPVKKKEKRNSDESEQSILTSISEAMGRISEPYSNSWDLDRLSTCLDDLLSRSEILSHLQNSKIERTSANALYCLQKGHGNVGTVSYVIEGASIVWYGMLAKDNERIIHYLKKNYPEDYALCPQAHEHKKFFIDPLELKRFFPDIKIFKVIQPPGHYLITAPGSFFEGFNLGSNLAQTAHFGTTEWKKTWTKAKLCFCIPKMWNTKIISMEQRRLKFAGEPEDERREKVESILNQPNDSFEGVLDMNINSFHYAKYRANSFAVIANIGTHQRIERTLINLAEISHPGKYILTPSSDPAEMNGAYMWRVYRAEFKTNPQIAQELAAKRLFKKLKNNEGKIFLTKENSVSHEPAELNFISYSSAEETSSFDGEIEYKSINHKSTMVKESAIEELRSKLKSKKMPETKVNNEEINTKKKKSKASGTTEGGGGGRGRGIQTDSVMISLNQLLSNNPDYAIVLQDCLIIPKYTSAERESPAKDNASDVLKPELLKNVNSFELVEICRQLKGTNLAILAKVTARYYHQRQQITSPPPPEYTDVKNLISIWCTSSSGKLGGFGFDFVLIDGGGVIRLNSRLGLNKAERAQFWATHVMQYFPEGREITLVCQDFQNLRQLFGVENDIRLNSVYIRETGSWKHKIVTLMRNKEEFKNLDLSNCTLEDLARFQRYYCFHPNQFSRDDLFYFQEFSSAWQSERHFLLCFEEQLGTEYWALCLINSHGQCILSRTAEDSDENLDVNVYRIMTEVVQTTDKIFYFKDLSRFDLFKQLRFFYVQSKPARGSKMTKPKVHDLLKEGREIQQSWVWENRNLEKYAPPASNKPYYQNLLY